MSYNTKITYFGIVRSISSWSKVARNILKELLNFRIDLSIYERKGFLYDKNFNLGELERFVDNSFKGDIVFTFEHPKNYIYLPKKTLNVGFLVYEYTSLPFDWVSNINKYLSFVFVPSKFTYDVFLKSGVDEKKLKILRYGVDRKIYFKKEKKEDIGNNKISFFSIGSTHKREGVDLLLKSFYLAFKDIYDVELILKLTYISKKTKSFEINDFNKLLDEYKKNLREKLIIITKKLDEFEIAKLYRSSNYYFSLSKAESFGLCFLESLASGTPTIALNYSGQSDFLNEENSFFIKHSIKETDGDEYEKTELKQYCAYPDIDDCVSKLREIYFNKMNKNFSFDYDYFDWKKITEEFLQIILK